MAAPPPVLIVSDAVSSPTGLGRIAREIAIRADANLKDVCRIATLGYGGPGTRRFNFFQYHIEGMKEDFVIHNLPEVWKDWAGDKAGFILCIWDCSRLGWFSRPNVMCEDPALKLFLTNAKIQRWIYNPVDAEGPYGKLSYPQVQSLLGFDRILAYGQFGENVIRKSLGDEASKERDLDHVPHGIDSTIFYPRDKINSRQNFISLTKATDLRGQKPQPLRDEELLVGTVATNQPRKDWGLWAESCALFLRQNPRARFWLLTDMMERPHCWSIPTLLVDFGLLDRTMISLGYIEDDDLAQVYSACDVTLGIGPEGFGYPLAESLFCGTPVVHGNYAGGAEFVGKEMLVDPDAYRLDGLYGLRRPVFDAEDWVDKIEYILGKRVNIPSQLDWQDVWPRFENWLRTGLSR